MSVTYTTMEIAIFKKTLSFLSIVYENFDGNDEIF